MNPIEEAKGIQDMVDRLKLLRKRLRALREEQITCCALRLLQLSKSIQDLLADNRLTAGHARALLSIENEKLRDEIAAAIIKKSLSVRETEKLVQSLNKKPKKAKVKQKPSYILEIESHLEESLGTRVQINGAKKGVIEIEYYSNEDLERILERVTNR